MFANQLLSNEVFPLKPTDSVETALMLMNDWKLLDLPVVEAGLLVGAISAKDIEDIGPRTKIKEFTKEVNIGLIQPEMHLFEVMKRLGETGLGCLMVVSQNQFLGVITPKEIAKGYQQSALQQPGGTVVLRMKPQDYALSEVARIMEYNDVKILHVFITQDASNIGKILISLKLNKSILTTVFQTLNRYNYDVVGIYDNTEVESDTKELDWFLKYLNT
ncbi:MAG: CBS domain-containing protein [Bacteroidia bacterium]|jgi:predicted transcriptional regulator|nr:CBS domain-containing protein [Bacteroidia bacterium]